MTPDELDLAFTKVRDELKMTSREARQKAEDEIRAYIGDVDMAKRLKCVKSHLSGSVSKSSIIAWMQGSYDDSIAEQKVYADALSQAIAEASTRGGWIRVMDLSAAVMSGCSGIAMLADQIMAMKEKEET